MTDFGKKVKTRREELGMTQEQLAEKLGYKVKSTITKIESGINDPVLSKVSDFASVLQVPISYFLDWESSPSFKTGTLDAIILKKTRQLTEDEKADVCEYIDLVIRRRTKQSRQ